jgi:RNA recognition motif-containing protein
MHAWYQVYQMDYRQTNWRVLRYKLLFLFFFLQLFYFYNNFLKGSTFLEMKDPDAAAAAVLKDQSKFMGRPLKVYYCPPRPGDKWPPRESSRPENNSSSSGPSQEKGEFKNNSNSKNSNNNANREDTPKPDGCRKLFAGNLSYEIDDNAMVEFFKDCGTLTGLRWLTRQDSGEFRVSFSFSLFFRLTLTLICSSLGLCFH